MAAPNFANRTLWTGDNLDILRGLNSETVDLIYLDPPFNSNRSYAAPVGSKAAGAAFQGRMDTVRPGRRLDGLDSRHRARRGRHPRRFWPLARARDAKLSHHDGRAPLGVAPRPKADG